MNFQTSVLFVAFILLIVVLIFIGYGMSKSQVTVWPPLVGDCPDYWIDLSGNGAQCVNIKDLGTCNGSVTAGQHAQMNFSVAPYIGSNGTCAKYKWAQGCNITWDGITEGITSPCDTTSSTTPSSST